jgi:hypothetical protein
MVFTLFSEEYTVGCCPLEHQCRATLRHDGMGLPVPKLSTGVLERQESSGHRSIAVLATESSSSRVAPSLA